MEGMQFFRDEPDAYGERLEYLSDRAKHKLESGVILARLLNDYDDKPSSDTWSAIQKLAREVLK